MIQWGSGARTYPLPACGADIYARKKTGLSHLRSYYCFFLAQIPPPEAPRRATRGAKPCTGRKLRRNFAAGVGWTCYEARN